MRSAIIAILMCLFSSLAAAREKTDVLVMRNGDRLTGQILLMQYGKLSLKSDYLGTATIEWLDVAHAQSSQQFVVEDLRGRYFAGTLAAGDAPRRIVVVHDDGATTSLGLDEIERVYASETMFFDRMSGSLALGFDYAKAGDIATVSGSFDTAYRAPAFRWSLTADLNSTKDPEQGTLDRQTLSFTYQWLLARQRFISGLSLLERNEETGVEARVQLGSAVGKYFRQTAKAELSGMLGAALTREWATGGADAQDSIEGILGANWRIFKFNAPTISMNAAGLVFPSLTDTGRYRTTFNVSLRRELVKDFYLDLSFYHSFDNEPPDPQAENSDYGLTTSLGYSFY